MKLAWIHYLRILAALGVVCIHASANVLFNYSDSQPIVWEVANFCNASARWTVPVFVMISGYLLLEPDYESTLEFYRRRLKRLLIPSIAAIIFFSAITFFQISDIHFSVSPLNFQYDTATVVAAGIKVLKKMANGYPFYHLWYLYMIFGLFLLTPLFRKVVERLSTRNLGILCGGLFAVTLAANLYISLVRGQSCLYIMGDSPFPTWFLPYVGYYFCGYFFRKQAVRINKWILAFIFTATIAATAGLCSYFAAKDGLEQGLFFYSFTGITVIPMSISIFLWFHNISCRENFTVETLGNLTFGVYLIHPFFQMVPEVIGLNPIIQRSVLGVPACALGVFITSAAVIYALVNLTQRSEMDRSMEERITLPPDERTTLF